MPINNLEYAKLMMQALDKQIIQGATSGWMENNAARVEYNGGDTVKIARMSTSGLADYDRDTGYTQGSVTLKFDPYTMTQDRGRTFTLDAMDVDETNFIATSANLIKEFQRTRVIPEIDAYRYSKIAKIAEDAGQTEAIALTPENALDKILEHIAALEDILGADQQLVITLSRPTLRLIEQSPKVDKYIDVSDFKQGELNFKVKSIDEHPIITVPSARLKTEYLIKDGKTDGQEDGGLEATETAKDINWLITPARVPLAINKTDVLRIFDPMTNQQANAWKIDFRKYHDLWILKNEENQIFVSTTA